MRNGLRNIELWLSIASIIVAGGALLISAKSCIRDEQQDKYIKEVAYTQNAMQYHPRIVFAESPRIIKCMMDTAKVHLNLDDFLKNIEIGKPPLLDIQFELLLTYQLKLTNIGESIGSLFAIVTADSLSSIKIIRERLLSDTYPYIKIKPFGRFMKTALLPLAADTVVFEITEKVSRLEDDEFAVHLMLLYENEMDQMYDTYYLQHCTMSTDSVPFIVDDGKLILGDITRAIRIYPYEFVPTYYYYKEAEAELIRNKFEDYWEIQKTKEDSVTS